MNIRRRSNTRRRSNIRRKKYKMRGGDGDDLDVYGYFDAPDGKTIIKCTREGSELKKQGTLKIDDKYYELKITTSGFGPNLHFRINKNKCGKETLESFDNIYFDKMGLTADEYIYNNYQILSIQNFGKMVIR